MQNLWQPPPANLRSRVQHSLLSPPGYNTGCLCRSSSCGPQCVRARVGMRAHTHQHESTCEHKSTRTDKHTCKLGAALLCLRVRSVHAALTMHTASVTANSNPSCDTASPMRLVPLNVPTLSSARYSTCTLPSAHPPRAGQRTPAHPRPACMRACPHRQTPTPSRYDPTPDARALSLPCATSVLPVHAPLTTAAGLKTSFSSHPTVALCHGHVKLLVW